MQGERSENIFLTRIVEEADFRGLSRFQLSCFSVGKHLIKTLFCTQEDVSIITERNGSFEHDNRLWLFIQIQYCILYPHEKHKAEVRKQPATVK